MEIRQLKPEEFDVSMDITEYAFVYKLSAEEREKRKTRFKPERFWGIFDNEELQARLLLLPLQVYVQGQVFPMGGIAGVATWPEKRRNGLVNQLLSHILTEMRENGTVLSFLHPFYIPFYRKFGWEVYVEHKKYTIPSDQLPEKHAVAGQIQRNEKRIEVLSSVYDTYARQYNGTLVRDADWWENSVLDAQMHTAVYYSENGVAEGYVLYKITRKELTVEELVYLNEAARTGLWTYISNHDSMVEQVVVEHAPSDDILPYLLRDPRVKQETVPYFMARIVDVTSFIRSYKFEPSNTDVTLRVMVEDHFAPWNAGLFEFSISAEGTGQLVQVAEDKIQNEATADINCDIQSLTAMLLGYKRPTELLRWGKIQGRADAVALLDARISPKTTALMDFF